MISARRTTVSAAEYPAALTRLQRIMAQADADPRLLRSQRTAAAW